MGQYVEEANFVCFVAYSRITRLVLSATLSVYGRRKPAIPVAPSVAVNLRAPAGTDSEG